MQQFKVGLSHIPTIESDAPEDLDRPEELET